MSDSPATVVADAHFLEAPRWREGRIWFSDFYGHRVSSCHQDGSDLRVEAEVPGQPSGLGWLPDGRLLIVSMTDRRLLRREKDGALSTHADLSSHVTGLANDMCVDSHGRAYVGNFGFDLMNMGDPAPTSLVRVEPDGSMHPEGKDLWFPNAMAIDGDTLLVG